MLLRTRFGLACCAAWALTTAMACQATPSPAPTTTTTPPRRAATAKVTPVGARSPWPPREPLNRSDYEKRLFEAFTRCQQFDLERLDGRWTVSESRALPAGSAVWICQGHIRWRDSIELINDICISQLAELPEGLHAEGVWHEDWHDPGDASGLYIRLRESNGHLIVDVSPWDEAPEVVTLFTLLRAGAAQAHEACPFE